MQTPYPIALKLARKRDIKIHLGTKFGGNMINSQGVVSDYSRKIMPVRCHSYRVNCLWKKAENQYMNRYLKAMVV